jgi:hypothetical protein
MRRQDAVPSRPNAAGQQSGLDRHNQAVVPIRIGLDLPGLPVDPLFAGLPGNDLIRLAALLNRPAREPCRIREFVGEGNDQYVDDMYTTPDGRLLIASRPSLRDVVAIRLSTGEIEWRFVVDGQRSDHMAISPDGRHVAVSASTGNVVHVLDTRTGEEVGRFPSGDSPHENVYSHDGKRIYHASIGLVYTPLDQPAFDSTKGERYFQVADAETFEILRRIDIGEKLDEAGYHDMSSAVRPMAHSRNERWFYMQVSFFHGFIEYDMRADRVRRGWSRCRRARR